ncbi:hypothetical protein RSPO_m00220 (plasmid) [Ralstonia solanacearum Po82]|uniref:Uncharacterized protein n=1 Tax=Ralstonia solanacearum (strain Po82) TaxID=1031711 RepID=F6G7C4_RALS8|nr:hypothetical protein RSPO_m00220 [Ralstonia solanacearum Po82]
MRGIHRWSPPWVIHVRPVRAAGFGQPRLQAPCHSQACPPLPSSSKTREPCPMPDTPPGPALRRRAATKSSRVRESTDLMNARRYQVA